MNWLRKHLPLRVPRVRPRPAERAAAAARVALAGGFAVVFTLWLVWGAQLQRSLGRVEENVAAVHEAYATGEQALLKVRTNVLLGSIYLRDALIDRGPDRLAFYRSELVRLRSEVDRSLAEYLPQVSSVEERGHWARVQSELAEFWQSRDVVFGDGGPHSTAEAAVWLRSRLVPQRNTILDLLDQLAGLHAVVAQRRAAEAGLLYKQVRWRLGAIGISTLLVALVVAVAAATFVNRLQDQIERQRLAERQNRQDLERLSARLVDVQEHDRQKLARELHDQVGQALTAVKMDIGVAMRADSPSRVREVLEEANEITEWTLRTVRDLSQLLHPSTLDDFGLPAALAAYLNGFSKRSGIRTDLAGTNGDRLPAAVELCIYRIVQEGLSNVGRHSAATACKVSLSVADGAARLIIEDNGRGLGPSIGLAEARRGLGLIAMRERAQALGGTFAIENQAGGGARIVVVLPVQGQAGAALTA